MHNIVLHNYIYSQDRLLVCPLGNQSVQREMSNWVVWSGKEDMSRLPYKRMLVSAWSGCGKGCGHRESTTICRDSGYDNTLIYTKFLRYLLER